MTKHFLQLRDQIILSYDGNSEMLPERGRLCNEDLELLRNWEWDTNISLEDDEFLTIEVNVYVFILRRFFKKKI